MYWGLSESDRRRVRRDEIQETTLERAYGRGFSCAPSTNKISYVTALENSNYDEVRGVVERLIVDKQKVKRRK